MNRNDKLERAREKLHQAIDEYGINSLEVQKISKRLDKLINEQYQHEVEYPEGSELKENYYKCIDILKYTLLETGEFPSVKDWNKYAKENFLLNHVSIEYISGMNWKKLKEFIRLEIK